MSTNKKKKSYPGAYIGTYDDTNTTFCMADTLWTAFLRLFLLPGVFVTWEPRISIPRRQFIIAIINVVEYHLFFLSSTTRTFGKLFSVIMAKNKKTKKKRGGCLWRIWGFILVRHLGNWLGFNIHGVFFLISAYACFSFYFQHTSYFSGVSIFHHLCLYVFMFFFFIMSCFFSARTYLNLCC